MKMIMSTSTTLKGSGFTPRFIKASNVRILNNVIDYSSEVVDNVPIEDFYVFGNIDSSNTSVTLDK